MKDIRMLDLQTVNKLPDRYEILTLDLLWIYGHLIKIPNLPSRSGFIENVIEKKLSLVKIINRSCVIQNTIGILIAGYRRR